MPITIRLFAGLAEVFGSSSLAFHVDEHPLTAGRLKALLAASYPDAAGQIGAALMAVDHEYAPDDTLITETSEVALIPPVSGGEPSTIYEGTEDGRYFITNQPLKAEELLDQVLDANHGASLVFVGTTREMTGSERTIALEYEAYIPMAVAKLQEIGRGTEARWGARCAIAHRIGLVGLKEASVVIAVSAPHREACYEASRYAIEELKRMVPVWKKDIGETGTKWKGAEQSPSDFRNG